MMTCGSTLVARMIGHILALRETSTDIIIPYKAKIGSGSTGISANLGSRTIAISVPKIYPCEGLKPWQE